ncbi:MAG: N-acetylmuramoyl-L-alanine amidase [Bifidobacteriaceae bacterium]|jgi:N-acetylmuramoyl-L-alanine amidase|nr:N-acetylmuramoyl-L-alanine amidase [Bifidobacteriaceae bacterium]
MVSTPVKVGALVGGACLVALGLGLLVASPLKTPDAAPQVSLSVSPTASASETAGPPTTAGVTIGQGKGPHDPPASSQVATTSPSPSASPDATVSPAPSGSQSAAANGASLAGRVVALDPGHQSGPGSNEQVADGRGGTKACNNSGTSTNAGYPEYEFTWDVVQRIRALLEAQGATVHVTKSTIDELVCVDQRGTFGQDSGSEIMVSIHGDGNSDPNFKGFFGIVSSPPVNDAQGEPSLELARAVLDQLAAAGFTQNPAMPNGIQPRYDIAGVALSEVPVVMFELGEMRNAEEAALMSSEEGRERYAQAVAAGITDYLLAHPK